MSQMSVEECIQEFVRSMRENGHKPPKRVVLSEDGMLSLRANKRLGLPWEVRLFVDGDEVIVDDRM